MWIAVTAVTAVTAVAVVLVVWLWRKGTQPAPNELDEPGAVGRMLAYLHDRGIDGAELRFQVRDDESRKVLFVKRIMADHRIVLLGTWCDESKQGDLYHLVQRALVQNGVSARAASASSQRCITIEASTDTVEAERFVATVFEAAFGVEIARDVVAYFRDTLVFQSSRLTGVERK